MLEEKNDNLQDADGNGVNEPQEVTIADNQGIPVDKQEESEASSETLEEKAGILTEELSEDDIEVAAEKEALVEETVEIAIEPEDEEEVEEVIAAPTEENVIELTEEQVADETPVGESENQAAVNAIEEANAEEGEDETLKERHDIPMLDYETLSMEQLVDELGTLVTVEKLMSVKDHVEELKKAFLSKYYHFIDEKKEEYYAENPDTTEDFHYHFPLKVKFDLS